MPESPCFCGYVPGGTGGGTARECGGCSNDPGSLCYCGPGPLATGGAATAHDSRAPLGDALAPGSGGAATVSDASSGGAPSTADAAGPVSLCGTTNHLGACVEYANHTCSLCDPGGCTESQICYALGNCDSLYQKCSAYFACALSATTCDESLACAPCQL